MTVYDTSWRLSAYLAAGPEDDTATAAKELALAAVESWSQLQQADIEFELMFMEPTTYKLSVLSASPAAIMVELFEASGCKGLYMKEVFASHGVTAQRIAYGEDWSIDQWAGNALMSSEDLEGFTELPYSAELPLSLEALHAVGVSMSRMHAVPIDWFEPIEADMRIRNSTLLHTPKGHQLWLFAMFAAETVDRRIWNLPGEIVQLWFELDLGCPFHPATSRLVCSNGDFGPHNLFQKHPADPFALASFEKSLVHHAVVDIAYAAVDWCSKPSNFALRKGLVRAYLQQSGFPDDDEQVELVLLDAEMSSLKQPGALRSPIPEGQQPAPDGLPETQDDPFSLASLVDSIACTDPEMSRELVQTKLILCDDARKLLNSARADAELRRVIAEKGIRGCKQFRAIMKADAGRVLKVKEAILQRERGGS